MKVGILGAGLTGVALKYFLPAADVLEKEPVAGGLCRSFSKDGFSYDLGGHIIFSKDEGMVSFITSLLSGNIVKHFRRNFVWFKGRFVKYPFENGMPDLSLADRLGCLLGYLARPNSVPKNFKEWIVRSFGKGFAEKYLFPYNEKIWKTPLEEIATSWVERIPDPPLKDILKGVLGIATEGYCHQLHFYYPKKGGIESLIRRFTDGQEHIRYNFKIQRIGKSGGGWIVSDGKQELKYERIISTIPVTELLHMIEGVPQNVIEASNKLRYNSLIVVLVGAKSNVNMDRLAVYFPQPHLIFHRVCLPHYFGENYVPKGSMSFAAEITTQRGSDVYNRTDDELAGRVIKDLARENFLKESDVITSEVRRVPYAYVIDTHERLSSMNIIRSYLDGEGITLCGRFAEFEYFNMDACIARARDTASKFAQ